MKAGGLVRDFPKLLTYYPTLAPKNLRIVVDADLLKVIFLRGQNLPS